MSKVGLRSDGVCKRELGLHNDQRSNVSGKWKMTKKKTFISNPTEVLIRTKQDGIGLDHQKHMTPEEKPPPPCPNGHVSIALGS